MNTLKTIIEWALAGGWDMFGHLHNIKGEWLCEDTHLIIQLERFDKRYLLEQIIFDIPFLKALFGEEKVCFYCGFTPGDKCLCRCSICSSYVIPTWQYHGQELVPMTNTARLDYLEKWMEERA
ncbi:hypothetical protein LCGC14_2489780 [marine sediment metagenome]|uniref:Uncharacterized protein n=1 Tax=marine sediment metagenome TaxID=412755 RepID=A0A0F9B549_9ZZZZ